MIIADFLNQRGKEPLGKLYLLVGEDRYQLWQAEQQLIHQFFPEGESSSGLIRFEKNPSAEELAVALVSPGFFATQTLGIVEDTQWLSSDKKGEDRKVEEVRIAELLGQLPEESCLIIKAAKVDKRTSLYKKISGLGIVLEGDFLKAQNLRTYVQRRAKEIGLTFQPDAFQWLISQWELLEGISVGLVNQELEKCLLYSQGRLLSQREVEDLLSELPEISAFRLLDAWSDGSEKSLKLLSEMMRNGEAPLKLLGLITWHVRNLWQVKALEKSSKDFIASRIGLRPFQVDRLLRTAKKMSENQIDSLVLSLAETDLALKNSLPATLILEKLLLLGSGK